MEQRAAPSLRVGLNGPPAPPAWFSDAVEKWARGWGRHATTRWEPRVGCYVSHLSRMASDPVLARHPDNEGEPIYWHEFKPGIRPHPVLGTARMIGGFKPMDIEQMGESGVLEYLNKHNAWSGTGEFASLDAAADAVVAANDKRVQEQQQKLREVTSELLKDAMRKARGHAQASVPDNISST